MYYFQWIFRSSHISCDQVFLSRRIIVAKMSLFTSVLHIPHDRNFKLVRMSPCQSSSWSLAFEMETPLKYQFSQRQIPSNWNVSPVYPFVFVYKTLTPAFSCVNFTLLIQGFGILLSMSDEVCFFWQTCWQQKLNVDYCVCTCILYIVTFHSNGQYSGVTLVVGPISLCKTQTRNSLLCSFIIHDSEKI